MGHGGCWSLYEPYSMIGECDTEQQLLFTADSGEFDAGTKNWQSVGVHFGRDDTFQP